MAKKTTTLSTHVTFFSGYTGTWPTISYISGSEVSSALQVLTQMIADLASGSYGPSPNPDIVPPASVTWPPILGAYYQFSATVQGVFAAKGLAAPAPSLVSGRRK